MVLRFQAIVRQTTNSMKFKRRGLIYFLTFTVVLLVVAKISMEGFVRMLRSAHTPYYISLGAIMKNSSVLPTNRLQYKTILLWTPFFGNKNYIQPLESQGCLEPRCNVTSDRSFLSHSDAILFHHRDLNPRDVPGERHSWQRWVYLNHESPLNSPREALNNLEDKFNWTISYRLDSDLILTPLPRLRKTPPQFETKDWSQNKSRMAVWFVSNCHTPGNREAYVKQLRKTIPVDIYGDCGLKKCVPKMSRECYMNVAKQYRFYLSFENSICKDYVTEKLYHVFDFDMVPVVFGGADYTKVAPPGSYINAMDFSSPRTLGKHLLEVAKSSETYNKFFHWKRTYENVVERYACELCAKLHNKDEPAKIWKNLKSWYFEGANCRRWTS